MIEFDDGVSFEVDFINRRLRDCEIPANIIELAALGDETSHYEFYYDRDKRNIGVPLSEDGSDSETIYKVKIDQLTGIHPHGMAAIYGVDYADLAGKSDRQFFSELPGIRERQWEQVKANTDPDLLTKRLSAEQTDVTIGNDPFLFDCKRGVFQHAIKSQVRIDISRMQAVDGCNGFACFVDAWDCRPIYENAAAFGLHMLAHLQIPDPVLIDPVGIARLRGLNDTDLLYRYPVPTKVEIKLTAFSERAENTIKNKLQQSGTEKKAAVASGRRKIRW